MSKQAIDGFRAAVNSNPALGAEFMSAMTESTSAIVALGKRHGYDFTAAEANEALHEMGSGELSDAELELVSAGGQSGVQSGAPQGVVTRDPSTGTSS